MARGKIGKRFTLVLPKEVRQDLAEEDLVEVLRREDGVIEIRPLAVVDKSQAWFWTEGWQRREKQADEDYAAGRYRIHETTAEFLAELEKHASIEGAPNPPTDQEQ